jgi:hypothetical protein
MVCGRSALLMLTACVLLGTASRGSAIERDPAQHTRLAMERHSGNASVLPHLARPSSGRAVSRFTPWKSRVKSVLEETNDKTVEVRDLGPVILPVKRSIAATFELLTRRLPTFPHLRC